MKVTGIIRGRRQLTIPEAIYKKALWADSGLPVILSVEKDNEIVIRPHRPKNEVDWDNIEKKLQIARKIMANSKVINLSAFIAHDREARR